MQRSIPYFPRWEVLFSSGESCSWACRRPQVLPGLCPRTNLSPHLDGVGMPRRSSG